MDKLMDLVNYFKTIDLKQVIDILITIAIIIFFYIFSSGLSYILIRIFKRKKTDKERIKKMPFYKPLKIFFIVLGVFLATRVLQIQGKAMDIIEMVFKIICVILFAKALAGCFNDDSKTMRKLQKKFMTEADDNRINFIYKIIRCVIYIIAILAVIALLGINLNTILAGLGIGSVVITLAAQDTAKNLFGGVMILIDKPFVIGDWVQTPNYEGIVEDISFRSTGIRTFDNSLVNIPNGVLSNEAVINWSKMEKRKYKLDLKLPLDTPVDVIQRITSKIYFMLINHPNVINDDTYVKFDEIDPDGVSIMIYVFTNSVDYGSYLNAKEHINKNILEILEKEGVDLAYPTSTVLVKDGNKIKDQGFGDVP